MLLDSARHLGDGGKAGLAPRDTLACMPFVNDGCSRRYQCVSKWCMALNGSDATCRSQFQMPMEDLGRVGPGDACTNMLCAREALWSAKMYQINCKIEAKACCTGLRAVQRAARLQTEGEADAGHTEEGQGRPPGERPAPDRTPLACPSFSSGAGKLVLCSSVSSAWLCEAPPHG